MREASHYAILITLAIALTAPFCAHAQDADVIPAARAQQILQGLIPFGKKSVALTAYVAGTNVQDIDLGLSCSSSSNGSTTGTVDDDGNVNATTKASGDTTCRERHLFKHTMYLGFEAKDPVGTRLMITAQCQRRWIWDHCDMPPQGTNYSFVIEAEKHGTFDIYAATAEKLGGKTKTARFTVLNVSYVPKAATSEADVSPITGHQGSDSPKKIQLGQTTDEVLAILGQPEKTVDLGDKKLFVYSDLKIAFLNGKVADVQ